MVKKSGWNQTSKFFCLLMDLHVTVCICMNLHVLACMCCCVSACIVWFVCICMCLYASVCNWWISPCPSSTYYGFKVAGSGCPMHFLHPSGSSSNNNVSGKPERQLKTHFIFVNSSTSSLSAEKLPTSSFLFFHSNVHLEFSRAQREWLWLKPAIKK